MILKYMDFLDKVRRSLGRMFITIGENLLEEHHDWWEWEE